MKRQQDMERAKRQAHAHHLNKFIDPLQDAAHRLDRAAQGLRNAGQGMSELGDFAYLTADNNADLRDKVQRLECLVLDLGRRLNTPPNST